MTDQTPASAPVPAQDTPGGPGRQPDAPEAPQTAMERRIAQSGVDTPGCDCGHEGMGVGWHGTDCAWRARTTPDNSATSGDAADNPLREQYAAAVECAIGLNVDCGGAEGVHRVRDAVLAIRDAELERLEKLHQAHLRVEARLAGGSLVAEAAVERVRAAADQLHRAVLNANGEPLTGYDRGVDTAVSRIVAALDEPVAGRESGERP